MDNYKELIAEIHFLKCIITEIKEEVEKDEKIKQESKKQIFSIIKKCTHSR